MQHMELVREKSRLEGEVARGALEARELQITATEALRDKVRPPPTLLTRVCV